MRIINLLIAIISCIVLVLFLGCIPVEELDSELWETAYLDSELAGRWKSNDSAIPYSADYVSFVKDEQSYKYCMEDTLSYSAIKDMPELQVKSYKTNNMQFLIFKDIGSSITNAAKNAVFKNKVSKSPLYHSHSAGTIDEILHRANNLIVRYEVIDDTLIYYQLIPGALSKLISEKMLQGKVLEKSDMFEARLSNIDPNGLKTLSEEKLWKPMRKFHRVEGIDSDINKTMYVDTIVKIDMDKMAACLSDVQIERIFDNIDSLPEWERNNFHNKTRFSLVKWPLESKISAGKLSGYDYDHLENPDLFELSPEEEEQEREKNRKSRFVMGGNLHYVEDVNDLKPFKRHYSVFVNPEAKEIDLRLWRDDQGMHSSVFIGQDRLWLEIREISWYTDRRKTLQFIAYMEKLFEKVR